MTSLMLNNCVTDLVSIITPLYNSAPFIEETIRSVLSQTYTNWEMIVVDDCSNDGGDHIVEKYLSCDSRIQLVRNKLKKGGADTRNVAIEKAQGRFIAFLDADDLWLPEKLDYQIKFMKSNNIDFSFSAYQTISENGAYLSQISAPPKVSLKDIYAFNPIGCLTVIYDTKNFGKFYMPNFHMKQDYALWLVMLAVFPHAYSIDKVLASYRIRNNSLSSNKLNGLFYYYKVLHETARLSKIKSVYFTLEYILITLIKRKLPRLYNSIILKP